MPSYNVSERFHAWCSKQLPRWWPLFFLAFYAVKLIHLFRNVDFHFSYPIMNADYALYYARALRAHAFYARSGRFWGYDPFDMAGYICGPIHEVGNLFTSQLCHYFSGFMSIWSTLLSFQMMAFAVMPFLILHAVYVWAKNGSLAWAAFAAVTLAHGIFEPYSRWLIEIGLFGFQVAVFISIWLVAWFWRLVQEWTPGRWIVFTVVLCALPMIHPGSAFIVAAPFVGIYFSCFRKISLRRHLALLGSLVALILTSLPWLRPAFAFSSWCVDVPYGVSGGFLQFCHWTWRDFIHAEMNPLRGIFNVVAVVFTAVSLLDIRRRSAGQASVLFLWLFFLLFLSVFGSMFAALNKFQPARFTTPFWILCYLLASGSICRIAWREWRMRVVIAVGMLFVCALFFSEPYAWPSLSNRPDVRQELFIKYLKKIAPLPGRVLQECSDDPDPMMSDLAGPLTKQPMLGGSNPGNNLITRSTLFTGRYFDPKYPDEPPKAFNRFIRDLSEKEFGDYLERYNVVLVAARYPKTIALLDGYPGLLKPRRKVGCYTLYDVRIDPSWFVVGSGRLQMDYDRLTMSGLAKGRLVLKSHWIPQFRSNPPVPIGPIPVGDDPVPFIEIDNSAGHDRIEIYNAGL